MYEFVRADTIATAGARVRLVQLRFHLVMRDADDGGLEALMEELEFLADFHAHLRVEVGKRLVKAASQCVRPDVREQTPCLPLGVNAREATSHAGAAARHAKPQCRFGSLPESIGGEKSSKQRITAAHRMNCAGRLRLARVPGSVARQESRTPCAETHQNVRALLQQSRRRALHLPQSAQSAARQLLELFEIRLNQPGTRREHRPQHPGPRVNAHERPSVAADAHRRQVISLSYAVRAAPAENNPVARSDPALDAAEEPLYLATTDAHASAEDVRVPLPLGFHQRNVHAR